MRFFKPYLQLARPHQYFKNAFVWLPLFFGYKLLDSQAIWLTFWTFLAFCLAASSVYVFNDLKDISEDRQHPVKSCRPLASGAIKPSQAVIFLAILLLLALALVAAFLPPLIFLIMGAYLVLNTVYSLFLKHLAIIDVFCIALGFVLRIFAGGLAAKVPVSHWLVIMTFLLALFLALAKRRDDLLLLAEGHNTRKSLDGYSLEFIQTSMAIMAAVIIVSYILYTVSPETISKHGTDQLYLTSFWVIVGLLRYLQITLVEGRSGSPTEILIKDHLLQAIIVLWLLCFFLPFYVFIP
ncbi:MAG: prenyltransferase [Deltaproteobacteria bacterium RBG_13_58_19]|nr:MAG: prenyltransferase [Deltaproteobacteria bacterium RBG_13_58_19]